MGLPIRTKILWFNLKPSMHQNPKRPHISTFDGGFLKTALDVRGYPDGRLQPSVDINPLPSLSRRQFQFGLETGACRQPYEHVHAESADFSSLQIRHSRLRNSQHPDGLGLCQTALLQPVLQAPEQL